MSLDDFINEIINIPHLFDKFTATTWIVVLVLIIVVMIVFRRK